VNFRHGFTIIELMIVVVIIGILTAIVIPNYISMQDRSKEAKVKGNAHAVHLAAEDYCVTHDGLYSVAAADLTPLLPGAQLLENAFSGALSEPQFGAPAAATGQIGIVAEMDGAVTVGFTINGFGKTAEIIQLTNGH
jgi:prepilin-type N-terminal cleavage/methylation domain-containing protein